MDKDDPTSAAETSASASAGQEPGRAEEAPFDLSEFKSVRAEGGLSLEQLSGAFASLFSSGADPYQTAPETPEEEAAQAGLFVPEESLRPGPGDEACDVSPRSIIEALLFVGRPDNGPLNGAEIAALMRGVRAAEVDDWIGELNQQYAAENRPYRIASHGDGYRLELCPECSAWRDAFYGKVRLAKLSQAAIDVLAIVAYNQPITAEEIQDLRGKPSGSVLTQLVRRKLLAVERSDDADRVTRFHTTDRFNQIFGLKSLDDLPRSQDVNVR